MLNTWYISSRGVPDCSWIRLKQRWHREQVVFDHMQFLNEMQHFGLSAATAMYHPVDLGLNCSSTF